MAFPKEFRSHSNNKDMAPPLAAGSYEETPYNELKNIDSLMISFDRTFNDDDDAQMKDVPHYQEFARDILSTLKQHRSIQGCVELLIACLAFVTLYSTMVAHNWWWSMGAALIAVALYFCVRTYLHTALCDALYHRINEWKSLIYCNTNYTLEWVPPEDWWNIYPGVQFIPKSSTSNNNNENTNDKNLPTTTEATITTASPAVVHLGHRNVTPPTITKYYVKIARFVPPRDLSARTIQDSTARPPALAADPDATGPFSKFLATAKARLLVDQREQLKRMTLVMIVSLIGLWLATEDADWVVRGLFLTLVAFDILDDCVLQHLLDQTDTTPKLLGGEVEEDDEEEDHENPKYKVTYHVEQPLFGLRETFFTIVRQEAELA